MLRALDGKIIEKFTKFSHWFQKLTGLTCYFFAKMGLFVVLVGLFLRVLNYFIQFLTIETILPALDIFFLFFFGLIFLRKIYLCNKAEENLFSSEVIRVEKESFVFRIWCLFFLVLDTTFLMPDLYEARYIMLEIMGRTGFFMGFTIYNYFVEVTPLPPGKSKVRQWIEGFFSVQPKLQPIPIKSDE
ncbi:MAG: hypothetical protein HYT65_00580 [Candidatus Yanofskybacteria bacterium]|nr:hypothetical protein [Candidatus Yanofskybacteria bacterium]